VTRTVNSWEVEGGFLAINTSLPMYDAQQSSPPVFAKIFGGICIMDVEQKDVDEALQKGVGYSSTRDRNSWDPTVVSMMSHFEEIDRYYRTVHSRNSFDDRGITLTALVHAKFKGPGGQLYANNAFFNPNMNIMVFGDGATAVPTLPAALDIVAHELTHGVVDYSSAFRYENQSGALHEHMADYFACMVDRDDWIMGENAVQGSQHVGWRDLSNPGNLSMMEPGPSSMAQYRNLPNTPEGDLGGVHVNSTIPSHAAYLFTDGPGGIGREKAERIVYRALTKYMSQYSEFVDYRRAAISAARDLYPGTQAETTVQQAFDSVQILEGAAAPAPTPVPTSQGEEMVAFLRAEHDPFLGFFLGYGLYAMDNQSIALVASEFAEPVRPAISGDGGWALYVGADNNIYWTDGEEEEQLTFDRRARTIAMSKDQRFIAFTTTDFESTIVVLDMQDETTRTAALRAQSRDEFEASFADVLSFNCTGDVLYFDAWTEGKLAQEGYGCWGLFSLRVKDLHCQALLPLSPGLQVGNPSLGNTLPGFLVADYVYTAQPGQEPTLGVVSLDMANNQVNALLTGLNILATPTFRGDDKQIVFRSYEGGFYYLNQATLSADRSGLVAGSGVPLIWSSDELTYPVGFRFGSYTAPSGKLTVSPSTLDFGAVPVGQITTAECEIRNVGNADLELIAFSIGGADASAFEIGGALNKRIPAGQSQKVAIRFAPKKAGPQSVSLRLQSNAPGQADLLVPISGSGEIQAAARLSLLFSGQDLTLSWPAAAGLHQIEETGSLRPAAWSVVPVQAALDGASYRATLTVQGREKYYRLRK
jgi:hypothetical protein